MQGESRERSNDGEVLKIPLVLIRNGSRTSNQTMGARWSSKATKRGLCAFFNKTGEPILGS